MSAREIDPVPEDEKADPAPEEEAASGRGERAPPAPEPTVAELWSPTASLGPGFEGAGGAESGSLEVGTCLAERFEIVRFIGKGGMGEVYEADDRELEQRVALKTVRPELSSDADTVARFRREIQLSRQVTHPNVCRIFDLFRHRQEDGEDLLFLTMELLDGETIGQRLARGGSLSSDEVRPLARQMAEALAAAHRTGVVHRDFKTSNVMLVPGPEGLRAVVTDFGLARSIVPTGSLAGSLTGGHTIIGTLSYMAPEQLARREVTPAVDVYACGMVLYQMLTGELPFERGGDPLSAAIRRSQEDPPSPREFRPELDPDWDHLVLRCLERDPAARFRDGSELLAALSGDGEAARPPGRRRTAVLATALAVLLAAAGLRLWWRPEPPAAAETVAARRSVAVLGLRNLLGRPEADWLATALPEMLTTELAAGSRLRVVPRGRVARMTVELGLPALDEIEPLARARVRRYLDADYLVLGSFSALGAAAGGKLRLDLRVQETGGNEPEFYVAATGTEGELFRLVASAGAELRQKLGVGDLAPAERRALRASLPGNFEAARLYAEGLAALRRSDPQTARDLLAAAVEADPDFPLSHAALAEAWSELGYDQEARTAAERAFGARSSLSREESLLVEGSYREMTQNWPQAIEVFGTLWRFFPDNLEYGLRLAEVQTRAGRGDEALATVAAMRALPAPSRDDPRIDVAEAVAASALSRFDRQLEAADRAALRAREEGAHQLLARALMERANALGSRGEWPPAVAAAEEAKAIYRQTGDRRGVGDAFKRQGIVWWSQGELAEARSAFEESATAYREIGDRRNVARSESNLAMVLLDTGDPSAAEAMFERALAGAEEVDDPQAVSAILHNLAVIRSRRGDFEEARRGFERALAIKRRIGEKGTVILTLGDLGLLAAKAGDLETARRHLEESLQISREIGDRLAIARYMTSLGRVEARAGHLAAAEELHRGALEIAREIGSKPVIAEALRGRGSLERWQGDLPAARTSLEEALAVAQEVGDAGEIARVEIQLAWVTLDEGRPGEAAEIGRRAAEALEDLGAVDEAWAREVLAVARLLSGEPRLAAAGLERARERIGNRGFRLAQLSLAVHGAGVEAVTGDPVAVAEGLRRTRDECRRSGLVGLGLEADLALGRLALAAGDAAAGRRGLEDLARRSGELGFGGIRRAASAALAAAAS